jgi:DNA repair protein RecO (recombination protein O)
VNDVVKEAFVLQTLDYKDSSKILYLYTNKGHLSVVARGVKKMNSKNRFLAQNGNLISFEHTSGTLPTLKEANLIKDYEHTKSDLECYSFINHVLELVHHVIDEMSDHEKMFHFLERLFDLFERGYDPEILSFIFEMKLLYFVGYGINFTTCNQCEEPSDLVYHVSSGGLVCRRHLNDLNETFEEEVYTILKWLYYVNIDVINDIELGKNERIMIRHIIDMTYEEFISYKTKSREILKQILKY